MARRLRGGTAAGRWGSGREGGGGGLKRSSPLRESCEVYWGQQRAELSLISIQMCCIRWVECGAAQGWKWVLFLHSALLGPRAKADKWINSDNTERKRNEEHWRVVEGDETEVILLTGFYTWKQKQQNHCAADWFGKCKIFFLFNSSSLCCLIFLPSSFYIFLLLPLLLLPPPLTDSNPPPPDPDPDSHNVRKMYLGVLRFLTASTTGVFLTKSFLIERCLCPFPRIGGMWEN